MEGCLTNTEGQASREWSKTNGRFFDWFHYVTCLCETLISRSRLTVISQFRRMAIFAAASTNKDVYRFLCIIITDGNSL